MLSYRHGFHAGNFADLLKHSVSCFVLDYLQEKPGSIQVLDTHSGAGLYDLHSPQAVKTLEWKQGAGQLGLSDAGQWPPLFQLFGQQLQAVNPQGQWRQYPGSPELFSRLLRPQDRLQLCELQSTELKALKSAYPQAQVKILAQDGLQQLAALHSQPQLRHLVLIDPSYEVKSEYAKVCEALQKAVKSCATGVFLIWYPLLALRNPQAFIAGLKKAAKVNQRPWLQIEHLPSPGGQGMFGSGMMVINPPWTLAQAAAEGLPWLDQQLTGGLGRVQIQSSEPS